MEDKYIYKIILLGDAYVGKSSFLSKYIKTCDEDTEYKHDDLPYNPTIGADFFTSIERDNSGRLIKCHIWDTAGQEKYRSITDIYMKNVAGAILMYDITNPNSFGSLHYWIRVLAENTKLENLSMIIVGNKIDRSDYRCIHKLETKQIASQYNAEYIETSVLNGENIDKIIPILINKISEKYFVNMNKEIAGIKVLSYEKEIDYNSNHYNCCIIS